MERTSWYDGGRVLAVGIVTAALILGAAFFAPTLSGQGRGQARRAPPAGWRRASALERELGSKLHAALIAAHPEAAHLRALALSGQHYGADARDLVIDDPGTVVILRRSLFHRRLTPCLGTGGRARPELDNERRER